MEKAQAGVGGEPCRGVGMESVGGQSELCLRFPGNGLVLPEGREC